MARADAEDGAPVAPRHGRGHGQVRDGQAVVMGSLEQQTEDGMTRAMRDVPADCDGRRRHARRVQGKGEDTEVSRG